ncbi:MAG: hypothetical protein WBA50_10760 [Mycobacterium sp.]
MARVVRTGDAPGGVNIYRELLKAEEARWNHRGRWRHVLVGSPGGGRTTEAGPKPPPLLAALRAGRPVEVSDWQLPKVARGSVEELRVRVHPDGRVERLG